jgi:thymidylate synthase (FAD)
MATKVPIEVFFISRTVADRDEMKRWLEFKGVKDYELPPESQVTDRALTIGVAAKRCYMSFDTTQNPNLQKVRNDWGEYLDNVLKVGHGSVLEHAVYSLAIENVSRVFTGEMNRHRAGWAISEGSMRFIRFSESIPYWEPDSIKGPDVLILGIAYTFLQGDSVKELLARLQRGVYMPATVDEKKHATRLLFERAFDDQRDLYKILELIWKDELAPESKFKQKKELTSLFRRLVGMGCATGGVWTGNIRALRHVLTMRCEPAAEEEILHVFSRVAKVIKEKEPMLFGDFYQDENGFWRPQYRKV